MTLEQHGCLKDMLQCLKHLCLGIWRCPFTLLDRTLSKICVEPLILGQQVPQSSQKKLHVFCKRLYPSCDPKVRGPILAQV